MAGSSIGGWITAEIALLASPRVTSVIIINGVGVDVPGHPVADIFALTLDQLTELSYHEPDRFRLDPATVTDRQKALMGANRQAIALYGGKTMTDPTLAGRLARVDHTHARPLGPERPVATPAYGRAYAAAIPGARYRRSNRPATSPRSKPQTPPSPPSGTSPTSTPPPGPPTDPPPRTAAGSRRRVQGRFPRTTRSEVRR